MAELVTFTVFGIATGAIYAVAASGLIVTYTTSGIFNFAHGATGMIAAFAYWQLRFGWGWPAPLAVVAVLFVLAPAFGFLVEITIMRGLARADEATRVVVTVGLLSALVGAALWIWPTDVARPFAPMFTGRKVEVLGAPITYHQLIAMGCAVLVAVGLALLLNRSRLGLDMRAVVDDRRLLVLYGGRPDLTAAASWAIGTSLAALAGILIAPTLQLAVFPLTLLVVNAYAAAVIGRLQSLPRAFAGAIAIGLAQAYAIGYLPRDIRWLGSIRSAIPVLILFVALLVVPKVRLRTQTGRASAKAYVPAPRPTRVALAGAAFVGAVALVGPRLGPTELFTANRALAIGLVALSLVPLLGYAGQLSLAQLSFAGIGALCMAHVGGGGSPWGLLAAFVVTACIGALLALPVLRLSGIYLALATGAFAVVLDRWLFTLPSITVFGWTIPLFESGSVRVSRLSVGPLSFREPEHQLILGALLFVLFALVVAWLRRSSYGRMLLAMRASPTASATLGMPIAVMRLGVFALSAGMAGVGGAMLAGVFTSVNPGMFSFFDGLPILLLTVVGGAGAVAGAFIGTALYAIFGILGEKQPGWQHLLAVLPGLAGIGLARNPGGLASDLHELVNRLRGMRGVGGEATVPLEAVGIDRPVTPRDIAELDAALGGDPSDPAPAGAAR